MKRTLIAMMLVGGLFAVTMPAQEGKIAERKENQQKRNANGVKSGQLTAGETAHLETNRKPA
jgi:type II secretory pathway pseudopilin PulG